MGYLGEEVVSEVDSLDWAANVHSKVAEDQRLSDGNLDFEGAVSPGFGHSDDSDHSTCESKPTIEVLQSGIHSRESLSKRTSSIRPSSKAKQRADDVVGTSGETLSGHGSYSEERTTANTGEGGEGGGSQSVTGRGGLFHEEEEPPASIVIPDNSSAHAAEEGDSGDWNEAGNIPNITRFNSARVDNVNGGYTADQNVSSNVLEFSGRLSESLGMAVATVFHEVFERNGNFGSRVSPVDELSGLLEAALKESLVVVLGNERSVFLEKFRNSFRSNYRTMRSVRRAFDKSRQLHTRSRRGLQEKSRGVSPSQSYRETARKNEIHGEHQRKQLPVEIGGVTKNSVVARHPHHTVGSISEEEITSSTPRRYTEPGQRVDSPCSSDKSCLNESLQSAFFTSTSLEHEGYSDIAGSCSKNCLYESLESSFFTSSNPEQDVNTRSCSLNSLNESMESLLSEPTLDDTNILMEYQDTEDSWGVDMFSASSSTETGEWVAVDNHDGISSAQGQSDSKKLEVPFDEWTSKEVHQHSRRVVKYGVQSPPVRCVGDSKQDTKPVGSSDSQGRCVSGDSLQLGKAVGSSDSFGKSLTGDSIRHGLPLNYSDSPAQGIVGVSIQETKSVGSSDNLTNYNDNSVQPETFSRFSRSSSDRVHATNSLQHQGDRLVKARNSQVMAVGATLEIGESSSGTEPRMNSQHAARGADSFGRLHTAEEGNAEIMIHRRPGRVRGDLTQLTGPLPEDDALLEAAPFFNYGVRTSRQVLLERFVEAQEIQNHLKSLEIAHSKMLLNAQLDHHQLLSESNVLMKENVDVSRSKIDLKEFELEDRKLSAAHRELRQMCGDELVAGLFVMFLALAYSAWKFSYARLSRVVTMCQLPPREPRRGSWLGTDWMANALDSASYRIQVMTCEVTKVGRMVAGLTLIAIVTTTLLSRSITSNSQTMPATVIIIFLAGMCGLAGKISIDALGGNGYVWLLYWWLLCFLHLFATSCTSWLYKYLYGPASKFYQTSTSFWMKLCSICARFSFHTALVLVLPLMAGCLPFASLDQLYIAFWELWENESSIRQY